MPETLRFLHHIRNERCNAGRVPELPRGQRSGLAESLDILKNVEGIGFVSLGQKDIVRHKLVTRIVNAYESHDKALAKSQETTRENS